MFAPVGATARPSPQFVVSEKMQRALLPAVERKDGKRPKKMGDKPDRVPILSIFFHSFSPPPESPRAGKRTFHHFIKKLVKTSLDACPQVRRTENTNDLGLLAKMAELLLPLSPRVTKMKALLEDFVENHCIPAEATFEEQLGETKGKLGNSLETQCNLHPMVTRALQIE